jgi:hypothetical protein
VAWCRVVGSSVCSNYWKQGPFVFWLLVYTFEAGVGRGGVGDRVHSRRMDTAGNFISY